MSATPIPRSLSLVLYEGLDYTIIDQLPKGRKTIITKLVDSEDKDMLYNDILRILELNEQVYWVCSCIDFTETLETEYLTSMYEKLSSRFTNCRN